MGKFYNISTDPTLGGSSASDSTVSSQKAVKEYVDSHSSGSPSWGSIQGTLSNQTDLQSALNGKADTDLSNLSATGDAKIFHIGMIIPWGGTVSNKPDGWLVCDGSAVSRTTYADLFAVIGTTYGTGDGSTTFNLPDFDFLLKGVSGNGMTLGLSGKTTNYGLRAEGGSGAYLEVYPGGYGSTTFPGTASGTKATSTYLRVTSDSTKSGIQSVIDTNTNYIIKY